ncbi:hypothetical protein HY029_01575 [Candidatus Gottesmanbacteria bacterium]|nr:hypothetical protein [Candidatus Gottesmanbacteria bacterium]
MKFLPARKYLLWIFSLVFVLFLVFNLSPGFLGHFTVLADAGAKTPKLGEGPSAADWQFDPVVTEVGKNAERARQLLWWVFNYPAVHTAPVLATLWRFSLTIVYAFIILVIVAFGITYIVFRKRVSSVNIPPIMVKVGGILLYATFSYIIILGLIQIGEVMMQFFINNVGGKDLFNVVFAGAGNAEVNYTGFVGYRDVNPINQEMVNSSLFLVRLTSLTYYVMAIILILRTIILWFLLIISPFLALLMPFIFIRNVGWIWIGVFFQWLFYGPMMTLFLGALTRIWVAGIPFPFHFDRVNTPAGQVYRTAINILYGGPAQVLSAGNSANYIDTYAEYVIALVMLWTCIILPWLLLRIFRDYCCEAIMAANSTLTAIFDRIRQIPPPPPPAPAPTSTSTAGMARELPFRQKVEEKVQQAQKEAISNLRDISAANTAELARAFDMSVSSLKDVSRLEMDKLASDRTRQNLQKMSQPSSVASSSEREKFATLKKELQTRAATGDIAASAMLGASERSKETLAAQIANASIMAKRPSVATPVTKGKYAPTVVRKPVTVAGKEVQTQVSVEDYEEVKKMWIKHYREAPVPTTDIITTRENWLSEDAKKLTNVSNMLASSDPKVKQKGLEEVAELLPFLMLGGFSDLETLTYLKAKLEAARQVQTELEIKEKAKEEVKAEVKEEEETLLDVEGKKAEEKKTAKLTEEQAMEFPQEKKDPVKPADANSPPEKTEEKK